MHTLSLQSISKSYGEKKVLVDITTTFTSGNIVALLGENGAGKSTLVQILTGEKQADKGNIYLDGVPVSFTNPGETKKVKIEAVQQRPVLALELTVFENVFIGQEGLGNKTKKMEIFNSLCQRLSVTIDPKTYVYKLSGDLRFYTSLLSALVSHPDFLFLDEPSTSLDSQQKNNLYDFINTLSKEGVGIILITHNINEALAIANSTLFLNKGKQVSQLPHFDTNHSVLPVTNIQNSEIVFSMKNFSYKPLWGQRLNDITLEVPQGTICCITGQRESGLEIFENIITGMYTYYPFNKNFTGTITLQNIELKKITPDFLRKNKIGIVPFDRIKRGSNPKLKIKEIVCGFTSKKEIDIDEYTKEIIKRADIDTSPSSFASTLSGGMLQRLIFQKEAAFSEKLLILCEPFQGMDSKTALSVMEAIFSLAKEGKAIIILTSDKNPLTTYQNSPILRTFSLSGGCIQ